MARSCLLFSLLLVSAACSDFPRDPEGTLEQARGRTLRVGVSESHPWVIRNGTEPVGVEPELVRQFADSIDARIEWIWGSAEEHYTALEQFELDLAVTGVTKSSPWSKRLGLSQPYHRSRVIIAKPRSHPSIESIDGQRVLVQDSGGYAGWVRDHDGIPEIVPEQELRDADALVATDEWRVPSLGLEPTPIVLHEHVHVLVGPPGENELLMALERSFRDAPIGSLIDEALQYEQRQSVMEPPPAGNA